MSSISHVNIFNNAYEAVEAFDNILTDAGFNVELDKHDFFNSARKTMDWAIEVEGGDYFDVEEQTNNELMVNLYMRHYYTNDKELYSYLKDNVYNLFNDYTLGGKVKKAYLSNTRNLIADEQRSKNYFLLRFRVMI